MQNTSLAVKVGEAAGDGTERKSAGGYTVSYRIQRAQGVYEFSTGKLDWKQPQEENVHVAVIVEDEETGRFVPELHVMMSLIDSRGGQAASSYLPFVWDPERFFYGTNVKVPSGDYTLQVHVSPATFDRADKERGMRFAGDVQLAFEGVRIEG